MIPTSTTDVARATGLSFRKLDYYVRRGLLRPEGGDGSGYARYWPDREIRVATVLARVADAGLSLDDSARIAREVVDAWYEVDAPSETPVRVTLGEGLVLEVAP